MENTWVFFYGTFMSSKILKGFGVVCKETYPAKLEGFKLVINHRVNLEKDDTSTVYGSLVNISNKDVSKLYNEIKNKFNIEYHPQGVKVNLMTGETKPVICYISSDKDNSTPDPNYIKEMIDCAAELNFPEEYIQHIKSFT